MNPSNKFTRKQQEHYDKFAPTWSPSNRDPIVGSFDQHNDWKDYDTYLFKGIETSGKIGLDFGCGPGRNIVKFRDRFERIDGVDISQANLDKASLWCSVNQISFIPKLYKNNGIDLDIVPSETYDVVFSTIAMQHISIYDIRFSMFRGFHRALKNGGSIAIQMGFDGPSVSSDSYYDNNTDKPLSDVKVSEPGLLQKDLERIGFRDFSYDIRPSGPGDTGHKEWIFFRATK